MGFHTRGEMGGIWAPPIKLLDGVWFGIDGEWLGPAQRFTSGRARPDGAARARRADGPAHRLRARRAAGRADRPDALVARRPHRRPATRRALRADGQLPVGRDEAIHQRTSTSRTRRDRRAARWCSPSGPPAAGAEPHDWAAAVGSRLTPAARRTGDGFRGPQGDVICPASGPGTDPQPDEPCDDTEYGKGKGGELTYKIKLPRSGGTTVWFGVAGSESARRRPRRAAQAARAPGRALRAKLREREALATLLAARAARRPAAPARHRVEQAEPRSTPSRRRATSSSARSTGARTTRAPRPRWPFARLSAPASRTTRGCSPPTAS